MYLFTYLLLSITRAAAVSGRCMYKLLSRDLFHLHVIYMLCIDCAINAAAAAAAADDDDDDGDDGCV